MTYEQTLTISIIAAVITGFFAVFGVVLTIRQNNKQLKAQMKIHKEEQQQKINDMRPEFEIECLTSRKTSSIRIITCVSDVDILYYPKDISEEEIEGEWKGYIYTFKNIGQQLIERIDVFALHSKILLCEIDSEKETALKSIDLIEQTSDITFYKRRIHSGDNFLIGIYLPGDYSICNFPKVSCCLVCKSFDKRIWRQDLHIGENVIEEANQITQQEYADLVNRSLYNV